MIYTADTENFKYIKHLLPEKLESCLWDGRHFCLFDTDEENMPIGIFLSEIKDEAAQIIWLYIEEAYRSKGRAKALLERFSIICKRSGCAQLIFVSIPAEHKAARFFLHAGFKMPEELDIEFSSTVGKLKENPFWNRKADTSNVVPMSKLKSFQLKQFMHAVYEQGNPAAFPADLESAELIEQLCLGFLDGEKLVGMLLCEPAEDGGILVSALHAIGSAAAARELLYTAGRLAIEQFNPQTPIHILTVNPVSARLLRKILGKVEKRYVCRLSMAAKKNRG